MTKEIRYLNTIEDIISCAYYEAEEIEIYKKNIRRGQIASSVWPVIIFLALSIYFRDPVAVIIGIILAGLGWVAYPHIYKKQVKKNILAMINESKGRVGTGEFKLIVNDTTLDVDNKYFKASFSWDAVEKIDILSDRSYVYLGQGIGLIIPRASVVEGNYGKFVDALKETFLKKVSNYALQRTRDCVRWTRATERER